jgi:hypothetical protein
MPALNIFLLCLDFYMCAKHGADQEKFMIALAVENTARHDYEKY